MTTVPTRDVRHLGDFTVTPRLLLIAALAVPVGVAAALASWVLVHLIGLVTNLVFYQRVATGLVAPGGQQHNPLLVLLAPVAGGLVVGLMARYGSERIRGHGMPETIEAVLVHGSRVQPRVAALKPLSAAVSIGTGGPFGAEGPIIMTGGALGSLLAQLVRLTADERKTLLVAGATAGMAATFNAPLASVVLAVELLLFEWRPRSLVPVATAVATASVVRVPLLGSGPLFPQDVAPHLTPVVYLLCVVSGVLCGVLAMVATQLVYASEDAFARLPLHWMWWPAIGGLVIGLGGLVEPRALGVGYDVIGEELAGTIGLGAVASIFVVKTLIWSLSLGSGTSGGVLAPTFLIGGALGSIESFLFPAVAPGFWAAIAVAGVLGGVMRAPLTGVAFAVELTGNLDLLLPLLIGSAAAYTFSVLVLRRSVLTEKIARRGHHLSREYDVDPLEVHFVSEVLAADVLRLRADLTVAEARDSIGTVVGGGETWQQRLYPVVDDEGRTVGVVTRRALLLEGDDTVLLTTLAHPPRVTTHLDQPLRQVAELMAEHEVSRVPVTTRDDPSRVVGVVSLSQLLTGRRRDQREARERERVLRPRLAVPSWRGRRRPTVVDAVDPVDPH